MLPIASLELTKAIAPSFETVPPNELSREFTGTEPAIVRTLDIRIGNLGDDNGVDKRGLGFPLRVELLDGGDIVSNDVMTDEVVSLGKHLETFFYRSRH